MLITININDSNKAQAFLNFIKSLDFLTVTENNDTLGYPVMSDEDIISRVEETNEQIKNGQTISQEELEKSVKNW
jgi:hypothetical protein